MNDEKTVTSFDDSEIGVRLTGMDRRYTRPVDIQLEISILLHDQTDLLGFYIQLLFMFQIGVLNHILQEELAPILGMSYPTFLTWRKKLEVCGLITIEGHGKLKFIAFNDVRRIGDIEFPNSPKAIIDYVKKLQKEIVILSPDVLEKEFKQQADQEAKLRIDAIIKEQVQKEKEKAKAKAKREEIRFPAEDYSLVLTAYTKYKGLGLQGTEIIRAKRAIKQMFLAKRSVKQIIDCMKFFHDNKNAEEYIWMRSWTIETIMKKIPEFIAGTLKVRTMDDDFPDA